MKMTHMFVGKDCNSIERVWGEGPTADIAETRCFDEAKVYIKERPDTGPLSRWSFSERFDVTS